MHLDNKKSTPGSPTKRRWDSPRTFVPEASTCCTPPINVKATENVEKRSKSNNVPIFRPPHPPKK